MTIELLFGNADLGQRNIYVLIAVPVLLSDGVRVVRMSERNLYIEKNVSISVVIKGKRLICSLKLLSSI